MQRADADVPAYGLKLLAGRAFEHGRIGDWTKLALNLAAVQAFGYPLPEAAIGQRYAFRVSLSGSQFLWPLIIMISIAVITSMSLMARWAAMSPATIVREV